MSERRSFVKKLLLGAASLNLAPNLLQAKEWANNRKNKIKNGIDPLRIALIGKGGMGTSDVNTALQVEGTKLVGVCDLYDARLNEVGKSWGEDIFLTKEYKDILSMENVDAVVVATPDHWHQQIAIEAMEAGKHVYCEKPVIHKLEEGKALIKAQEESGALFQIGSQGMASLGNRAARELVLAGAIGKVNYVEAQFSAAPKDLQKFVAPDDATEGTIWWDRFIGNAPQHKFDPQRFFAWRNWKDYGTGLPGDLFVHVLSSIHYITDAKGPEKVYSTGGLRHYTDGSRDTPDIILGYFDYPDRKNIGAFTVSLGANMVDGVSKRWGSTDFKLVGDKGTLVVNWDKVVLKTMEEADIQSFESLSRIGQGIDVPKKISSREYAFHAEKGYKGGHYDHLNNFITGVRNKTPLTADVLFGVRASSAALLSIESFRKGKPVFWNAEQLKIEKKKK